MTGKSGDTDSRLRYERLRASVQSRVRQARPALVAMLINTGFTVPLLGRGLSPALLAIWLFAIVGLLFVRLATARSAEREPDAPYERQVIFDRQFRTVSMLSQSVTGAGIWLVLPVRDLETAGYIMTLLIAFYGVGAMINLAHDYRSVRMSLPLLLGQPVLFWLLEGRDGVVIAVILVGLTGLMILAARNSQQTFDNSILIRFEKDDALEQLEQEKKIASDALAEAEAANRAKSFFMASASHDLRQPLYAATILADTLALHPLEPSAAALVAQQRDALGAASGLFDNLLDLSKFESGVIEPTMGAVRLRELLEQMQTEFSTMAESKGLYLELRLDAPDVHSDYDLLSRLLRNLVSNAIRYTQRGGVRIWADAVGDRVELHVEDTGIGIAAEDQQRVFGEFVQLGNPQRARDKGVGLGLAIVRRIASLLLHELVVDSAPGRGTRMTVRLRRATQADAVVTKVAGLRISSLADLDVWVVEDDPLVRDALRAYFYERGCRVMTAQTRAELSVLERQHGLPDVVILDDMLGAEETGLELGLWLATRMPKERILLTTGNVAADRWKVLMTSGLTTFRKPVTAAVLDEWLADQQGAG